MKKMVTDTMLMPAYASRFSCLGGDCEDTCCAGWGITLDKDSFLRYQSSFDPVLRPLFTQHVKRYAKSKSDEDYGHIELVKDECKSCPLLDERKLCRIHERLGEKALSDTCSHYPRTIHRFGGLHQLTLDLSCPEAARLALLAEDAFDFVAEDRTISQGFITVVRSKEGINLAAMEEVRSLIVQILRSPDIPLSSRLRVVGLFCERLDGLIQQRRFEDLPGLLGDMEQDLDSGAAMASLAGFAALPEVQAQVSAPFLMAGLKAFQSPHVRRVLEEVAQGLGFRDGLAPEGPDLVRCYEMGLARLAPALETVPWLMEHLVLNEVLRELLPWSEEGPKRQFAGLVVRHATARLLLVGRAASREVILSPLELAETVQVASRGFAHDKNLVRHSHQVLEDSGWDNLERLYTLI